MDQISDIFSMVSLEMEIAMIWPFLPENCQKHITAGCKQVSGGSLAAPSLTDYRVTISLSVMHNMQLWTGTEFTLLVSQSKRPKDKPRDFKNSFDFKIL